MNESRRAYGEEPYGGARYAYAYGYGHSGSATIDTLVPVFRRPF